jgi:glycosyltransferase involved in cell wall biosynthesis
MGSKIKVAQIRWGEPIGGVERVLRDLANHIDKDAFTVHFIFLRTAGAYETDMRASGHEVLVIPVRNGYDVRMRIALARALKEFVPDIVNEHGGLPPLVRPLLKVVTRKPLISFEHGEIEINQRRGKAWVNAVNGFEFRYFSNRIIVNSLLNKNLLVSHHHLSPEMVRVVHLGIDLEQFAYKPEIPKAKELVLGYVGRIYNYDKGTDALPLLASELSRRGVGDFKLMVIGDGPDRNAVQSQAEQLNVAQYFNFLGRQPCVHDLLADIDILVVPSKTEAFGLVAVEALAAGTRVVAFATGALPEVLSGCPDALLVPQRDIPAMANAIMAIWKSTGKQRTEAGRQFVVDRYDAKRMVREIEAVYRNEFKG